MNQTDEFHEQQRVLRKDLGSWYREWDNDRAALWGRFVFALSLLRAMKVPWTIISAHVGIHRRTLRDQYWNKIYPERDDIQRYANAGTVGKIATLEECKDLWHSLSLFEESLEKQVRLYHSMGASWRTIGKVVHLTRQGAQQRFGDKPLTRSHLRIVDSSPRQSMMPGSGTSAGSLNTERSSG